MLFNAITESHKVCLVWFVLNFTTFLSEIYRASSLFLTSVPFSSTFSLPLTNPFTFPVLLKSQVSVGMALCSFLWVDRKVGWLLGNLAGWLVLCGLHKANLILYILCVPSVLHCTLSMYPLHCTLCVYPFHLATIASTNINT